MYRVIVHRRVYLDSSRSSSVLLKREVRLPFPPFLGLCLSSGVWLTDPISRVCWLVEDGYFSCEVPPLLPDTASIATIETQIEYQVADGWERNR